MRKKSKCVTGFDKNFHECYTEKIGENRLCEGDKCSQAGDRNGYRNTGIIIAGLF